MIKINLVKKKKQTSTTPGGAKFDIKNLDLAALFAFLKSGQGDGEKKFDINGPIPKIAIMIGLCWFIDNTLSGYKQEALQRFDKEISAIEKEKSGVVARLNKIKGFEPIKKQLEEDERAIRTKIDVVNKLLENRNAPAQMMMQIAQSIPDELWLTELKVSEGSVKIGGSTPGYNQVSDFIKSLNSTSQFTEIGLSGIQESTSAAKDQRFQTFELNAKRRLSN